MNYIFPFEKLQVWQLSKNLAIRIYLNTSEFPKSEKYVLIDQMQRSVVSISSNIAEGNSRKSKIDRIKFLNIAYSSLMELISQSIIANELGYLNDESTEEIRTMGIEISNKLKALIASHVEFTN